MSDVNWVMHGHFDPEKSYFAVATDGLRIPIWHLRGFQLLGRYTQENIEQMRGYETLVAYALDTQFGLMTNSRTLSIWEDMASIRDYSYKGAHAASMTALATLPSLRVKHAIWRFEGAAGLPTWADGHARIQRPSATATKPA